MNIHHLADLAVIAQALLALVAALVVYWQITAAKSESKKWKTLEACAQYESEPIASSVVRLRHLYSPHLYEDESRPKRNPDPSLDCQTRRLSFVGSNAGKEQWNF